MAGSIKDRASALLGMLPSHPYCGRVGPMDSVKAALSWYGMHHRRFLREMSVTPIDDSYAWVELGGYGLAWLRKVPLGELARALNELKTPGNSHYYFDPTTTVAEGDHVIDAGACEGVFGLECIRRYGAERVYNFEPDSRMARALALTAERNRLGERYRVFRAAVGAESGVLPFS